MPLLPPPVLLRPRGRLRVGHRPSAANAETLCVLIQLNARFRFGELANDERVPASRFPEDILHLVGGCSACVDFMRFLSLRVRTTIKESICLRWRRPLDACLVAPPLKLRCICLALLEDVLIHVVLRQYASVLVVQAEDPPMLEGKLRPLQTPLLDEIVLGSDVQNCLSERFECRDGALRRACLGILTGAKLGHVLC